MKTYNVTGMSCAACSSRVEKAVKKVEGVSNCSVNLLTGSMVVEGSAGEETIIEAVENAGYKATIKGEEKNIPSQDLEYKALKKRFISSVIVLIPLMYIAMGHTMFWLQFVLATVIAVWNRKFFINGIKGLWHKAPNMDTLVALGAFAAMVYSVWGLFESKHVHDMYFESAAMILTLITLGKMLEARAKGKTTDALRGLMQMAPKTAVLQINGMEKTVEISEVQVGDTFVVYPGASIPVDGIVLHGTSAVDESLLTGESNPIDKKENDTVCAATINQSGHLVCKATGVGEDTALAQIIRLVSDASSSKAPVAKTADRVAGVFVPAVLVIGLVTCLGWILAGESVGFALARGISVLVISCPCALGLATPVAIMVGSGVGAKHGVLFKTATALEELGRAKIIALDKTGTVTNGNPVVTDIFPDEGIEEIQLLFVAASLESKSEHPLARAVCKYAEDKSITTGEVTEFSVEAGNGIAGIVDGKTCVAGKEEYVATSAVISEKIKEQCRKYAGEGKTPFCFAKEGRVLGVIAVADTVKEDSKIAVEALTKMGLRVVMLTGDHSETAKAIAGQVGITEVFSRVLPGEKQERIELLQKEGKTVMVGDGINDAPALMRADVGVAIKAGTDIAMDAADVVIMKSSLLDLADAVRLSRATLKIIYQNLFWAFCYNIIGIPLAAGVFIPVWGWQLNPMFAAAAMSVSSFCVVCNSLRLNRFKSIGHMKKTEDEQVQKIDIQMREIDEAKKTEDAQMKQVTMKIEGMMCEHCQARVKKCLEKLPQVSEADVDFKEGTAKVTLETETDIEILRKTVEDQDYEVISIDD